MSPRAKALESRSELFRLLPSVDELLRRDDVEAIVAREGRALVVDAARAVLSDLRARINRGELNDAALRSRIDKLGNDVEAQLAGELRPSLVPVINCTGVILHTNLGRAPLPRQAMERIAEIATQYSNLEFDIAAGERGKRDIHAQRFLDKLFAGVRADAVSTVVVNNNAAAVLLVLNSLAEGGEVVVSRGELVEIGGSFRIPDVMSKSQATLREVGTTNRTRIGDYEKAINERTRMLLRVHRSNFEIVGFTEQPSLEELVALGRKHNIPVVEDQGSGALVDLAEFGIKGEQNVFDSLRAGVDLVTYSGDKMLGGPQAGLVSGRVDLVGRVRSNPLFRALRVDKMTYAALETALLAYVRRDYSALPALAMMQVGVEELRARAEAIAAAATGSVRCEIVESSALVGGGAAPGTTLPSIAISVASDGRSCDELATALRMQKPSVLAHVEEGRVLLDMRTILPGQEEAVRTALARLAE